VTPNAPDEAERVDVAIVGGGPIGLELATALQEVGIDYLLFEAHQIGYTISTWPRHTHFFSTAERIAIAGVPIPVNEHDHITGEHYLAYLRAVVQQFGLRINAYERVVTLKRSETGFQLGTETRTGERAYHSRYVVLATGDMGTVKAMGIPGENLPHVTHLLDDPHRYFGQRLLVVGGGNSALEFAARCWRAGAEVTLSYRRAQFNPLFVKSRLIEDFETLARETKITFLPETVPIEISPTHVTLAPTRDGRPVGGERIQLPADFVLLCTGYAADLRLFEKAGVTFEEACPQPGQGPAGRVPQFDAETMETSVPGLYVAGTAASGEQARHRLFIETSHHHVTKIVKAISGREPTRVNTLVPKGPPDFSK
jgi:thioredoxin reductase (NADPH)